MTGLHALSRHWNVFRASWKLESDRRKRSFRFSESDFLPAALEVMETPASPVGRSILWAIMAFVAIASTWAYFGHVDVVATAAGRLTPREQVKVIQSGELGTVRAIHVRNGQAVAAGDVLIELDPTISGAEELQARQAVIKAQMSLARARRLIAYLDDATIDLDSSGQTDDLISESNKELLESQFREYEARRSALQETGEELRAERKAIEQQIEKLTKTLPLVEAQVRAREPLVAKGLSPRLEFLELQERLVAQEQDILIQKSQQERVLATINANARQLQQLAEEFRRQALSEQTEAEQAIEVLSEDVTKALQRSKLQRLVSPIDGVVQQLAVHTVGGVVEPAQTLAVVVPTSGDLVVDALVLNKDIGFVAKGQDVEVKLEAFPFTRYGVVHGIVEHVSRDSIEHESFGLVYPARIALKEQIISVAGESIDLGPGMAATAEIKTDTRRIMQFLLSPLLRYRSESFRER